jgi:uncharacterized membrane protein YtjA (UPF0391 family)
VFQRELRARLGSLGWGRSAGSAGGAAARLIFVILSILSILSSLLFQKERDR